MTRKIDRGMNYSSKTGSEKVCANRIGLAGSGSGLLKRNAESIQLLVKTGSGSGLLMIADPVQLLWIAIASNLHQWNMSFPSTYMAE